MVIVWRIATIVTVTVLTRIQTYRTLFATYTRNVTNFALLSFF